MALEKDNFLEAILESFSDPLYVIDVKDYSIIIANTAARNKGVDTAKTCYVLTHRINKPCWQNHELCPLKMVLERKESVVVEHTHYDKEGNAGIFEVHGYPVFNRAGEVKYMIEYSFNITERRKKEEALKQALDDLTVFKNITIERENKMIDLKKQVNKVYKEIGREEPFDLSFLDK